jgi:hypothetical protein
VSVVYQRPHDLFFYARPSAMLKGRVDPPGCWLDASAVLVRQYLGYCFDSATHAGIRKELPRTGGQLVSDLNHPNGHIPTVLQWLHDHEAELQRCFLERFQDDIQSDTRRRFLDDTTADRLQQRIHQAANDFDRTRRELVNARARLQDQLKSLDEMEQEARRDIEEELHLLLGRVCTASTVPTPWKSLPTTDCCQTMPSPSVACDFMERSITAIAEISRNISRSNWRGRPARRCASWHRTTCSIPTAGSLRFNRSRSAMPSNH